MTDDGAAGRGRSRRVPLSRAERREQTREALIHAARAIFARDGYHAANLEAIAHEAGFTKGAVYSNFESKAVLFLAVMDANLAAVGQEGWDPHGQVDQAPEPGSEQARELAELAEAMQGFGLASLEFIAAAGRDEALKAQLGKRMRVMVDLFTSVAAGARADEDPLSAEELGGLLAALDQGGAIVALSGGSVLDERLLRVGMRRLIAGGTVPEEMEVGGAGGPGLHDQEIRRRIAASVREGQEPASG